MDPTSPIDGNSQPLNNKTDLVDENAAEGRLGAKSIKSFNTGDTNSIAKKVSYAPDTFFPEGKRKIRPHTRSSEREKGAVVTTRDNDYQRKEMLDRLAQGMPEDLQKFSTLFKQSQCRSNFDELKKLMDAVLDKQASLSTKAVGLMLKTYFDCQIDMNVRLAAKYISIGFNEAWYFLFSLEQLRGCEVEGFSPRDVRCAKQALAVEIASAYDTELPENWEGLPAVSDRILNKGQKEREAVKKDAEMVVQKFEKDLLRNLKSWIESELENDPATLPEDERGKHSLNTLGDALSYVEVDSHMKYLTEEFDGFLENCQTSNEPVRFPKKVRQKAIEMINTKYSYLRK